MKTFKRSFVFLLALVMLCGVILSATVPASALDTPVKGKQCNDYRGWAQDDPRWYNVKLNKCKELTFWHAGCAIISYTKLLIQSGVKDTSFLPSDMNTWMRNNGGFTDSRNTNDLLKVFILSPPYTGLFEKTPFYGPLPFPVSS